MNPHKLIFDYLDGEITREDDKELRELLKEDSQLSRDYRSILDIHYEIEKSNDNFVYPEQFLDNVEEMILGRMDADNAVKQEKERRRKAYLWYSLAAVPTFILLFMFSSMNFGNLVNDLNKFIMNNSSEVSEVVQTKENITEEIGTVSNQKISTGNQTSIVANSIAKNGIKSPKSKLAKSNEVNTRISTSLISSDININNEKLTTVSPDVQGTLANTINSQENEKTSLTSNSGVSDKNTSLSNSIVNQNTANDEILQYSSNLPDNNKIANEFNSLNSNKKNSGLKNPNGTYSNPEFNQFGSVFGNSDIEFNSFFGKEFAAFGVNNNQNIVNSFTQSIGAKVDDYTRIGIETGYMQITGEESAFIIIKKSNSAGIGNTVLDNSDEENVLIKTQGTQITDRKMFWAGLFYERNMLQYDKFSFSSRLSIGASDVGFVSSLKLMGRYQLLNNLDFTLGADAKLFNGTQEFFVSKNSFSSTLSLIYGIRFAF